MVHGSLTLAGNSERRFAVGKNNFSSPSSIFKCTNDLSTAYSERGGWRFEFPPRVLSLLEAILQEEGNAAHPPTHTAG